MIVILGWHNVGQLLNIVILGWQNLGKLQMIVILGWHNVGQLLNIVILGRHNVDLLLMIVILGWHNVGQLLNIVILGWHNVGLLLMIVILGWHNVGLLLVIVLLPMIDIHPNFWCRMLTNEIWFRKCWLTVLYTRIHHVLMKGVKTSIWLVNLLGFYYYFFYVKQMESTTICLCFDATKCVICIMEGANKMELAIKKRKRPHWVSIKYITNILSMLSILSCQQHCKIT